ncbi:hypothetical protein DFH11DRAFT_1803772 [Phellopilus nigrolimitatus]|nr:hypothetical protein DFH11DRAFT_1803772 [Phellopilus nigrolimitatus]
MIVASPRPVAAAPPSLPVLEMTSLLAEECFSRIGFSAAGGSGVRPSVSPAHNRAHVATAAPSTKYSRPHHHHQASTSTTTSSTISARCSFVTLDSESEPGSPSSASGNSNSGSEQGMSCPTTPAMDNCLALGSPRTADKDLDLAESVSSDDTLGTDLQIRPSDLSIFARTPSLYLPNVSLPPAALAADALDRADNRPDQDGIIGQRLAHNSLLLRRNSALTIEAVSATGSEYGDDAASAYEYDPARASVQTYGSSVLTYGSRASQYFGPEDAGGEDGGTEDAAQPYEVPRPSHPFPWAPRPSAMSRVASARCARRPLPPIPTGITGRMRSASESEASQKSGSNANAGSSFGSSAGSSRRPRPLPRTPTSTCHSISPLSDIAEDASPSGSGGGVRPNSMFLSPTTPSSAALHGRARHSMKGRRLSTARFSTIGYGQAARARLSIRTAFGNENDTGDASGGKDAGRVSRASSVRSGVSHYQVPDVDELVRILDQMDEPLSPFSPGYDDDGAGAASPSAPANEEIDMGQALLRSRSCVSVRGGQGRSAEALDSVRCAGISIGIGLPTPAATPSPPRASAPLPHTQQAAGAPPSPLTELQSPALSVAPSLTSFPLPPGSLAICAPRALGVGDMPIPSAEPSPGFGVSFAERATLPGMQAPMRAGAGPQRVEAPAPAPPQKSRRTRDAIADLKNRMSALPAPPPAERFPDVPLLSQPVPPRRRALSVTPNAKTDAHGNTAATASAAWMPGTAPTLSASPETPTANRPDTTPTPGAVPALSLATGWRKPGYPATGRPPAIDVKAANSLPPPSAFNHPFALGEPAAATSAPAHSSASKANNNASPTILYTTPPVAPLRLRRLTGQSMASTNAETAAPPRPPATHIPPPSTVPQSASAAVTSFSSAAPLVPGRFPGTRQHRSASLCASPGSGGTPAVAPLRFRNSKLGPRESSATVSAGIGAPPSRDAAPSSSSESEELATPMTFAAPSTHIEEITEPEEGCGTGMSTLSNVSSDSSYSTQSEFAGTASLDPALADIIKSIAGASEEEQMGSLLTLASSINTEHHGHTVDFGFGLGGPAGDLQAQLEERKRRRASVVSGTSSSDRRRSKGRSRRASARSAVRAAIRALPDPSTFPLPPPTSGGSVATNSSAASAAADFAGFAAPQPRLRVVTKFKGGSGALLPAAQAPGSAVSTRSTASCMSGMSTLSGGVPRRTSVAGPRKMNRLTLTDPRSPMADAAVAAATLVARVRQKRQALGARGPHGGVSRAPRGPGGTAGHRRSTSNGTLRSKLLLTGSGFFGSSVCAFPDPVLRNGPKVARPSVRRGARPDRSSCVAESPNGSPLFGLSQL